MLRFAPLLLLPFAAAPGGSTTAGAPACREPSVSPPSAYVEKGVCPGECCAYGEWTARAAVELRALPGEARVVGRIKKGEKVEAETGEVHVAPLRSCAIRAHTLDAYAASGGAGKVLAPGDVFWVLSPVGEGYATIWFDGMLYTANALFAVGNPCAEDPDGEACWAKVRAPRADVEAWLRHRWWVRVRTSKGLVGWVDNTADVLTGFDTCG